MKKLSVRFISVAFTAALLLALMLAAALPVAAEAYPDRVFDEAGLLSDSEENRLNDSIAALRKKTGLDCVVLTVNSIGSKSATAYADDFYDDRANGFSSDGVLILVSMEDHDWAISTTGKGIKVLNDRRLKDMESGIVSKMSDKNWYGAFDRFISRTSDAYDAYEAGYDGFNKGNYTFLYLIIVPGIAIIIGFAVVSVMKSAMNTARPRNQAADYVRPGSFVLTDKRDLFLYSKTTKIRRQTSSSSSGGSTTHTGSSGTSHGGSSGKF